MRRVTGTEALKALINGEILEKDEKFYKYNDFMREFFMSPDLTHWTSSWLAINDITNNEWTAIGGKKKEKIR
jgi:hypothetical protein